MVLRTHAVARAGHDGDHAARNVNAFARGPDAATTVSLRSTTSAAYFARLPSARPAIMIADASAVACTDAPPSGIALRAPAVVSADLPVGHRVVRLCVMLRMTAQANASMVVHDTMHRVGAGDRGRGRHRDHRARRRCRPRRHRPPQ
ncbi:MAG: hypothetical protein OXI22_11050 [Defluviicoccus sp.]|nr:hypothetical protein [Defluviicoccus sp.]